MKLKLTLIALIILAFSSCNESRDVLVELTKEETQCANAWDSWSGTDPLPVEKLVEVYLELNGLPIDLENIHISGSYTVACLACHCPTGRTIHIKVTEDQVPLANSLGFYE